jgi:hypothetical protein
MRTIIYLGILVVGAAAQGARPMHGYWPYMSRASFDLLFAIAAGLFLLLLALGIKAGWKHRHWRDWEAWAAVATVAIGLWYVYCRQSSRAAVP